MTAALRKARAQARATGQAKLGKCILAEMAAPYRGPKLKGVALLSALRVKEIEALIRHRHGHMVPDARGTDDEETCTGYVMAIAGSLAEIRGWSRRWLPWLDDDAVFAQTEALRSKLANGKLGPRLLPADAVATMLHVRMAERTELGLTTIGAVDLSEKQRRAAAKARKRLRDRERQRAKREAQDRTPRTVYLAASAEAAKPWVEAGVSRRTWYRRRNGTGSSRAIYIDNGGDTLVPSIDQSSETNPSAKSEGLGQGTKFLAEFQEAEPHGASYGRGGHG